GGRQLHRLRALKRAASGSAPFAKRERRPLFREPTGRLRGRHGAAAGPALGSPRPQGGAHPMKNLLVSAKFLALDLASTLVLLTVLRLTHSIPIAAGLG